ncbi:DUF4180 domain-containing protein [Candidatus Woesebacteria bacterium]|nr:DUF4180 domain-containing protein [Candidatus Woesebacteria bacterium]
MQLKTLQPNKVIYIVSDQVLITKEQDILDLIGETEFLDLVLHDYNFAPETFDLSSKILGDFLQKATNYRVRLAVIGDFSKYSSKILPDFIRESNRSKNYLFVTTLENVKVLWNL